MSSKDKGEQETIIRFAPYIESKHETFLDTSASWGATLINDSPFESYSDVDFDNGFFGSGYTMSSFPALYDMYGKFMAGLDVDSLWEQMLDATQDSNTINNLVTAESDLMTDEIEQNVLPRFQLGMRDINAVMSSSFVVGQSVLESARVKSIAKFDAEIKYKLIPIAAEIWSRHLEWNKSVIAAYSNIMQLYINSKMTADSQNSEMNLKDKLWPFTVLDFQRANLAALQGATSGKVAGGEVSQAAKSVSGALGGAAMGASVGGPYGAVIGGALGLAASFL